MSTTTTLALAPEAQDLLFRTARTANTFTDEPVSDELLQEVYDLTKWAPTSLNSQPLRVVFVRPGEGRDRLLKHMSEGNREKTAAAPVVAILAADTDFHEHLPTQVPFFPNAKAMFDGERANREAMARSNAMLQVGYFLLGVRAAGLAAGPMTGFDAQGLDEEFFADGRLRSLVVMNIGKPGENAWFDRSPRLDTEHVVTFL